MILEAFGHILGVRPIAQITALNTILTAIEMVLTAISVGKNLHLTITIEGTMKYYIVIKIFAVVYTSLGPYDTQQQCQTSMAQYRAEALQRYAQGERITFMGLDVKPSKVSASCKVK